MSAPTPPSATAPKPLDRATSSPGFAAPPSQLELLQAIDARLERIEARLATLDPLIDALTQAAPGVLAMAGDSVDELARELGDADERIRGLVALAERVSRPATLAQLHGLFDLLDAGPGLLAIAGDTVDELAREAEARGIPLEQIVPELRRVLGSMLRLLTSSQVEQLLDSDLLLPGAIAALGSAARSMAMAARAPETKLGLFATLSAMREPEVQRAVGFAIDVARRFGANVEQLQLPEARS